MIRHWRWNLFFGFLLLAMLVHSTPTLVTLEDHIRVYTRAYEYDYANWTLAALWEKTTQATVNLPAYLTAVQQKQIVLDYLQIVNQIDQVEGNIQAIYTDPTIKDPGSAASTLLEEQGNLQDQRELYGPLAESILQGQVSSVLSDQGLSFAGQPFPPVLYRVNPLPMALIVSPRNEIRQEANISLLPDLPLDVITAIETQVESNLDVSALVVPVGGIGTYPTMVMSTTDLGWLVEVVAHEWTHNYLTLRPLGMNYDTSPELRTMNETTANIVGKEISLSVLERFYPELVPAPAPATSTSGNPPEAAPPVFDFNKEMHRTRVVVDRLLASGQIASAERYLEQRRQVFLKNGYQIRRLNQAYFAFYGAYADTPGGAAGEDPVGPAVTELRTRSRSLADFLHTIAGMSSFAELEQAIGQ
jgi:hypothetical protein